MLGERARGRRAVGVGIAERARRLALECIGLALHLRELAGQTRERLRVGGAVADELRAIAGRGGACRNVGRIAGENLVLRGLRPPAEVAASAWSPCSCARATARCSSRVEISVVMLSIDLSETTNGFAATTLLIAVSIARILFASPASSVERRLTLTS